MKHLPVLLIALRFFSGVTILVLTYFHVSNFSTIAICLLTFGLLTDIFDGIIARRLNVSTQLLRRLDSTVDQAFFICFAVTTYIQCPLFFQENKNELIILFASEISIYIVCYLKFRKEIATHSIGAKVWTLLLFATIIQLILECQSGWLFTLCFYVGVITRLENISIIFILIKWTNDVPTIIHAFQLRKGKEIKRNKLFNG